MSISKGRRATIYRPSREALEGRELLSKTIRGVDPDGDTWALRLFGPGDISVVNQNGADGQPVPLGQPALIRSISLAGGSPASTRLVGTVRRGANGDGRVFFASLSESASTPPASNVGVGILAIDIPGFWLGSTDPASTTPVQGTIDIPDGVVTLRFGGIDTTFGGRDTNNRSDAYNVNLGLPFRIGTSIIVDRVITSNQPAVGTGQPSRDTATFTVDGRINLFQANAIEGDETLDLGDTGVYDGINEGGTTVTSGQAGTTFLGTVVGFIGRFRVGGKATNLTVAASPTAQGDQGAITNFSIGGETNKVSVSGDRVIRTAQFGLGMDTVFMAAERMQYLGANRGAVGSQVITERDAGLMNFGGDVTDTLVLAGYAGGAGNFQAQELGRLTVLVAGDVTNAVFASSVEPNEDGVFGSADDLNLTGSLDAKIEGFIDNSASPLVDPDAGDQAFFARNLKVARGPITPPAADGPPYRPTLGPGRTPGVQGVSGGPRGPIFRFVRRGANRG